MRRVIAAVIVAAALGPASAFAGNLELRLGAFFPRADSTLFLDNEDLFGTKKDDWIGPTGGLEFSLGGRNTELGFHIDAYSATLDTSYRLYNRPRGGEIFQTLELNSAPIGMTARYVVGRRHARIRPYIGAGVDLVVWEYKESGSFIDFADDGEIVDNEAFMADGVAPGAHVVVGLRFAITPDIFLTAEGKYLATTTVEMKDDFEVVRTDVAPSRINLSGPSATLGVLVRF